MDVSLAKKLEDRRETVVEGDPKLHDFA